MEQISAPVWLELAKQVPNLVVFAAIVWLFMRGQKDLASKFEGTLVGYVKSRDEATQELGMRTTKVVEENTDVIKDNSKILGAVSARLYNKGA